MTHRMERVNATLQRELGHLITEKLVDPRIATLTSVTAVHTSRDLAVATVYVSVLGTDAERTETLEALEAASQKLRHVVRDRIRMRAIPRLRFRIDDTFDRTQPVLDLIDQVAEDRGHENERDGGSHE